MSQETHIVFVIFPGITILDAIGADDTTGKPVGTIGEVTKKEVSLQDILLKRRDEGMLYIGKAETLTG